MDQIFDLLVKGKQIKVPEDYKHPLVDQIQNIKYCKWHNSYSHYTNNCTIFHNVIQKALKWGRFKLENKKGAKMTIDTNSFPLATINMVFILAECKHAKKEASYSQPV